MNYPFLPNNIPNLTTKYPNHTCDQNQELEPPTSTKLVNLGSRLTTSRCTWIHNNKEPRNTTTGSATPKPKPELECGTKTKSFFSTSNRAHLVLDLVLLGVLERDVVLGQPRLPLPVLQQDEPDLRRRGRSNQGEEQERIKETIGEIGCGGLVTMAEDDGDA